MFLRRCERRKNGKKHTYWALVESFRTARGSRQRVIAYLGELRSGERSGWAQLGRTLSGKRRTRPPRSLFDPGGCEEAADCPSVRVRLKNVRFERLRDFGDVWLAWGLWRLLELDVLLEELIPVGREDVPWPQVAAVLVIARLPDPVVCSRLNSLTRIVTIRGVYEPKRNHRPRDARRAVRGGMTPGDAVAVYCGRVSTGSHPELL
jgi:hypothetical protein